MKEFFKGISLKQYLILAVVLVGWTYLTLKFNDVNFAAELSETDKVLLPFIGAE